MGLSVAILLLDPPRLRAIRESAQSFSLLFHSLDCTDLANPSRERDHSERYVSVDCWVDFGCSSPGDSQTPVIKWKEIGTKASPRSSGVTQLETKPNDQNISKQPLWRTLAIFHSQDQTTTELPGVWNIKNSFCCFLLEVMFFQVHPVHLALIKDVHQQILCVYHPKKEREASVESTHLRKGKIPLSNPDFNP